MSDESGSSAEVGCLGWEAYFVPSRELFANKTPKCVHVGKGRENESGLGIDFCHENLFPFLSFPARFSTRRWARSILFTFPKDFSPQPALTLHRQFRFHITCPIHIIHRHSRSCTFRKSFRFSFTGTVITVDFWYVPLMNETERIRPSRRTTKL